MTVATLKRILANINDDAEIMVFDPNNAHFLELESVSMNGEAVQLNMPDVRFWYELIENPDEWDGFIHGYGSHDPEEAMALLHYAVNEDGYTEAFLQVYGEDNKPIEKLYA